jgi:hypothetical protein
MMSIIRLVIRKQFARWQVKDSYGTVIHTHSISDAIDWLSYCGSGRATVLDRWNEEIVIERNC